MGRLAIVTIGLTLVLALVRDVVADALFSLASCGEIPGLYSQTTAGLLSLALVASAHLAAAWVVLRWRDFSAMGSLAVAAAVVVLSFLLYAFMIWLVGVVLSILVSDLGFNVILLLWALSTVLIAQCFPASHFGARTEQSHHADTHR